MKNGVLAALLLVLCSCALQKQAPPLPVTRTVGVNLIQRQVCAAEWKIVTEVLLSYGVEVIEDHRAARTLICMQGSPFWMRLFNWVPIHGRRQGWVATVYVGPSELQNSKAMVYMVLQLLGASSSWRGVMFPDADVALFATGLSAKTLEEVQYAQ